MQSWKPTLERIFRDPTRLELHLPTSPDRASDEIQSLHKTQTFQSDAIFRSAPITLGGAGFSAIVPQKGLFGTIFKPHFAFPHTKLKWCRLLGNTSVIHEPTLLLRDFPWCPAHTRELRQRASPHRNRFAASAKLSAISTNGRL